MVEKNKQRWDERFEARVRAFFGKIKLPKWLQRIRASLSQHFLLLLKAILRPQQRCLVILSWQASRVGTQNQ